MTTKDPKLKAAVEEFNNEIEAFGHIEAEAHPECMEWVCDRIIGHFNLDVSQIKDTQRNIITEFLVGDEKKRTLFCYLNSPNGTEDNIQLTLSIGYPYLSSRVAVGSMNQDLIYFLRVDVRKDVTPENIDVVVNYGTCSAGLTMDTFLRTMQYVMAPTLLRNKSWPDSIQKDFRTIMNKFMAALTESTNRLKGKTVLYVPVENMTEQKLKVAHNDKELMVQFENVVQHWTRQIREVVSEKDVESSSDNQGPLDEIAYWRMRTQDLSNIRKQFNRKEVLQIVDVLHRTKSQFYLEPFLAQKSEIVNGTEEALDNLKYLKTLEEPCKKLAVAEPKDIPALIPGILKRTQMIFLLSKHYKKERFSRLIKMIANEIINRCSKSICLPDIYAGKVEQSMIALQQSVEAGEAWQTECRKMLKATQAHVRSDSERLEIEESIFNEIHSFVRNQCQSLQEVCKGQLQFGFRALTYNVNEEVDTKRYIGALPCFGGTKGPEIESFLMDIQRTFKSKIDMLRRLEYDILDVKATSWSDDFRVIKTEFDNLGIMMTQIISSAFDLVSTVEGGAELIEAFYYLARREELERAVEKKKDDVMQLFNRELLAVQKELQRYHSKDPPILYLHSQWAGQAFWARTFRYRIVSSYRLLHRCWYLKDSKHKTEAFNLYNRLEKTTLEEYIKSRYKAWKEALPLDATAYLENHLIDVRPREKGVNTYVVNFAPELVVLFEEARYWQRLGEAIPQQVQDICHREERLRNFREHVGLAVRAYNNIVLSLTHKERPLFACRIAFLDSRYAPMANKQRWSSPDIIPVVQACRTQAEKNVQNIVSDYKHSMQLIDWYCGILASTPAISIEKKHAYELSVFEEIQTQHREKVKKRIQECYDRIVAQMKLLFDHFRNDYQSDEAIRHEWHRFVEEIDGKIAKAVKTLVDKSVQEIEKALQIGGVDEKERNAHPFLKLDVVLEHNVHDSNVKNKVKGELKPSIEEVRAKMQLISRAIMNIVADLPRLEAELTRIIDEETDEELEVRFGREKWIRVKHESPYPDMKPKGLYFDTAAKENVQSSQRITEALNAEGGKLAKEIEAKVIEADKSTSKDSAGKQDDKNLQLWAAKDQIINLLKKNPWPLEQFKRTIDDLYAHERAIAAWTSQVDHNFVRLNFAPMKKSVQQQCLYWVDNYLDLLSEKSRNSLDDFYNKWDDTVRKLSATTRNLDQLGEQLDLIAKSQKEKILIRAQFDPLREQYKRLEDYKRQIPENEMKRINGIDEAFDEYCVQLDLLDEDLKQRRAQFQSDLEQDLRAFQSACEQLRKDLLENGPYIYGLKSKEAFIKIADYRQKLKDRREKEAQLKQGMEVFKIIRPPQNDLKEVQAELELLTKVWEMVDRWRLDSEQWKTQQFSTIDNDNAADTVEVMRKDVLRLRKEMERRDVWHNLFQDIELFRKVLPILGDLIHVSIKPRHWDQLRIQIGGDWDPESPDFCLNMLIKRDIDKQHEFVGNLAVAAKNEMKIETDLDKIEECWKTTELKMDDYQAEYSKISGTDDIYNTLQEQLTLLGTTKMSRFVEAFKKRVEYWEQKLSMMTDTLDAYLSVQQKWMYLENIFIGFEDIKATLKEETKIFEGVHHNWLTQMKRLRDDPNVLKATNRDGLLDNLNEMAGKLERIQKSLESFLEMRRRKFPRFYFLSNDDLLEILGHVKEPEKVQPHLRKCFEGLFKLELGDGPKKVIYAKAMYAQDGEKVPFPGNGVKVEGESVEKWLSSVERMMKETVHCILIATLNDLQNSEGLYKPRRGRVHTPKTEQLQKWLKREGQPLITAACINWSQVVEKHIKEYENIGGGGRRKKSPIYRVYRIWRRVIRRYCEMIRERMDKLQRNKLVSLITIEVHNRDILKHLQQQRVCSLSDFAWTRQLRFYRTEEDRCIICQTSAVVNYDYEYLGNSGRLVVTPLTDRAYMTLTTALQLYRGGLPQGPAGTGKTETVKDLGKAIAKYVIVFNCSDGLDYKSLGRMFSGLAQTGGWSCFDEFNRIEVEVLSVVAQQIFIILQAVAEVKAREVKNPGGNAKKSFLFEGVEIDLNTDCGIFVTMNPGYAGRSELPDNLKALLRPISMMTPDFALICEITLLSQGFTKSQELAQKVTILYELMEKQLSKQDHYDFSLRNVKAVLVQAGNLKRESGNKDDPPDEYQLCLKACSDMNLPKFVRDDLPLFQGMLSDLFQGVTLPPSELASLENASRKCLAKEKLQVSEHLVVKVCHLYDTLNTRHGVMVVGQSGSGKTVTWTTLANASKYLKEQGVEGWEPTKFHIINPKAVTMDELYGSYNKATREWKDGILSNLMRTICNDDSPINKWLLFDGPVDTLWIESMNTVLDDNKMLTLNSGERINMTPVIRMMFEVQDLSQASPATVSRCGMVFFNVEDLGWKPYVTTWLQKSRRDLEIAINGPKPENTLVEIQTFVDQYLAKAIDFRRRECSELFPTTDICAVRSFTKLFDAIAHPDAPPVIPGKQNFNPQDADHYLAHIRMLCTFSMIWAIGGTLTEDSRRKFDLMIREADGTIPSADTGFEYYVDYLSHSWRSWDDHPDLQRTFSPEEGTPYYRLLVPTVDTIRYNHVIGLLVQSRIHTVLVGNTGTGKSLCASNVVRHLSNQTHVSCQLNFSAQTTSKNVQDIIEGKMDHKSKKFCSPPGGRRMVCVVEDLNMPAKEKFGAQPPLELIRQWIDSGSWYDRGTQVKRTVNEMQLLCCMTFGRPQISQRLLSKLNVMCITFPAEAVVTKIFTSILSHRFQKIPDFLPYCDLLVKATVAVYNKVTTEKLPIPSKSHYLFNLRDLSKVFQGMYSAYMDNSQTKEYLFTLWMHECFRVFSDRLNDLKDKEWFKTLMEDKLATLFQAKWKTLLKDGRNPCFVDFWEGDFDDLAKYKLVPSNEELRKKLDDQLENFNAEPGARAMNLVFFTDAMEHVCRIHRIIRQPRGNALLVGLGGSGRTCLTRLATYLAGYSIFSIEIHKKYDSERFHEDLRTLYKACGGVKKQQKVFIFSDNQILHLSFLEDLNNMLSVGEVPNLFPKDETQQLYDDLRKEAIENGFKDTKDEVYNFFIDRARRNLHLVVCMSPAQKDFRTRLRQFPALVSNTTIDWFIDWPNEALKEVAKRFLEDQEGDDEQRIESLADMFVYVHETTHAASSRLKEQLKRHNYVTPTSYLDLVRGYCTLRESKRIELEVQRNKLQTGMFKLDETKESVGKMSADLKIQEAQLREKSREVEIAMEHISHQKQLASEQQAVLATEKSKIERDTLAAVAFAEEAKADLDKAMPALEAAIAALDSIAKKDLDEMKSFPRPPPLVKLTMEAVQTALKRGVEWDDAKKSLADPRSFMDMLKSYPERIKEGSVDLKVLNTMNNRYLTSKEWDINKIKSQSAAAHGLAIWAKAIYQFGKTWEQVNPIIKKKEQAEARVKAQEEALRKKMAKLQEVLDKVAELERQNQANVDEKNRLRAEALETEEKLKRAQIIVSGLEGERDRWTTSITSYSLSIGNLVGDALLASAFLSYTGAFPFDFRHELLSLWGKEVRRLQIPMTYSSKASEKNFDFVDFFVDPTEVRDWQSVGLPGDDFSKENGVVVTRGTRWPLMIDPQQQANRWIKELEKHNGLKVIDPKQSDYIKTIEYAVQFGVPVLFQDILEDVDPALDTVISKAIIKKGSRYMIKIGDNTIDYNEKFKLYLTTRMQNPHYTPEICTKVCLLNFAVKEQGLEEQLLKVVVSIERNDLEEDNDKLIKSTAAAKKETKRLEDEILTLLSESDKSLLENIKLIDTLQTSKKTAADISKQLKDAESMSEKITSAREQYRECAKRASILFFVLSDLGYIDSMYQFALDAYILLFQQNIVRSSEKIRDDIITDRVKTLNDWHTEQVYRNTCRGLFERHKLLFSMHMSVRILMGDSRVNKEEFAYFIKGGQVLDKDAQTPNPAPEWLPEKCWDNIFELDKLLNFHGIAQSWVDLINEWKNFFLDEKPEEAIMPGEWQSKTSDSYLQRMVLTRCVRSDRVIFMVQKYISDMLEPKYIDPPPFNLGDTFDESRNLLPLIFVLSPGVDPANQLDGLAQRKGRNLRSLALGQGQGPTATKYILESAQTGGWVFLANCHLMVSWLQELEKIIESLPNLKPHDNFRLWLSSIPTPSFPIGILQKAVKMTTEPPTGIKANMSMLYNYITDEQFARGSEDPAKVGFYRPMLFALCFFHSVLLERKKFGNLGYNVIYDFNLSDFDVSENILQLYISQMPDVKPETIPFTTVRYLIAEASYGGRVTDDWDRRLMNTYMDQFMGLLTVTDQEGYHFSSDARYAVPIEAPPLHAFREAVAMLPLLDPPEAFGQHANADIASQISNSNNLLDNLMTVNATLVRGGGAPSASGQQKEVVTPEMACEHMLNTMEETIPQPIDYDAVLEATVEDRGSALNTCLLQEIQRYNVLLQKIHRQKAELRRAIKGEIALIDDLENIFISLLIGKVPMPWTTAYPSSKGLASWVRDLGERIKELVNWSRAAPKVYWMSGLTYPTGFLKALQQQQSRRDQIPIDKYTWEFIVRPSEDKTIAHAAKDGAFIRGIYLEGAGWNVESTMLVEPNAMELIVPMPLIHFKPKKREGRPKMKGIYLCPLYMYPLRTGTRERPSFVLGVELLTGQSPPEHWTKRGTALLLSTDE